jgi:hypothetical protein
MKKKILVGSAVMAMALAIVGCVGTVSDTHTAGFHVPDSVQGRYARSLDEVYQASVQVVEHEGVLVTEYIPHDTTNSVRSLQGKVNQEDVWIRVESIDPQITQVTVQARSGMGGDVQQAHEIDKDIALQLSRAQ